MASSFDSYIGQSATNITIAIHISKTGAVGSNLFTRSDTDKTIENTDEECFLSIAPLSIPINTSYGMDNIFFSPLLLNIPNIQVGIDTITRNLKISASALKISNAEYKGWRFIESFNDCVGGTVS